MRPVGALALVALLGGCQTPPPVTPNKPAAVPPAVQAEKPQSPAAEGLTTAVAKDGSFTIGMPKGWVPLTGETPETVALKAKIAKAQPSMARQLSIVADNPAVLFYAMDVAMMDGKHDFVDNINVNVQVAGFGEWNEAATKKVAEQFKKIFEDDKLQSGMIEVEGKKVFRYRCTVKVAEPYYDIIGYQYLHGGKVYTVTVSTAKGKIDGREKEFDKVGTSLRFKS